MNKFLVISLGAFLGAVGSAQGHHSYAAFFQVDERIRLEGVVEQFLAQNPHGYIVFNVVNEAGESEQWRAEMPGWVGLSRGRGWKADDLQPGDPITIVGAPASTGDGTLIRADDIVMPDGWTRHLFNDPATGRRREATPPPGVVADVSSSPQPYYPPPRTDGEWAGLGRGVGPEQRHLRRSPRHLGSGREVRQRSSDGRGSTSAGGSPPGRRPGLALHQTNSVDLDDQPEPNTVQQRR